jgi:hypothetical protein
MAVPVGVISELDHIKKTVETFVVCGLFVFSSIIDQPNAIQAIRTTVIPNPENASSILFPISPSTMTARKAHY